MTTLPQTTPMRAPRPAGNGQLAMPGMIAPGAGVAPGSLSAADVWRILRANLVLIVCTLFVAGVAGYLMNMWLLAKHARYTSIALLRVRDEGDIPSDLYHVSAGVNAQGLEIEQRTQAKQLTNEALLSSVLANSRLIRETDWFKQFVTYKNGRQDPDIQAAKQDLLEHLDVSPVVSSRLIEVRMSYSIPKDCQTIVQELCDIHIKEAKSRQTADQEERIRSLNTLKEEYESRRSIQSSTLDNLARELARNGVSVGGASSKSIELQELIQQRSDVLKTEIENRTKLVTFNNQLQTGTAPQIAQALNFDGRVSQLRAQVGMAEIELGDMELRYGKENKNYEGMARRLERLQKQLADAEELLKVNMQQMIQSQFEDAATSAAKAREQIQKNIEQVTRDISELSAKQLEYERRLADLRDLNQKLDRVNDEKDKIGTLLSSGRFSPVDWAQYPNMPDTPSFPRLGIVMSLAVLLGLGLSVGIAFLREVTDTTVRSPRDVARVGQMTLLGMIPHESDDPQLSGGRLPLAIYEAPHSMVAEQFRQVRTRLQHAASLDTTRSILVTGCSAEDGKTTVACNIAAGLALNGRRILLVDANFRRPNLHAVFSVGNEAGFGDVLNTPDTFEDCVRATEVPNLSVMPTGSRPSNPTELLESQLLIDFIERALEEYDHVIFDSGPLLMVSDSIALAPRVDGVITVVRARGNSRGLLQRVRDELRRLKAEHLGVVLNAVRVQGGGYYGPMIKNYYAYSR